MIGRNRLPYVAWLALFAALIAPAVAIAQQPTAVRVAYVPAAPGLAAWVALDKGFFAAEGLDVSLVPLQNISLVPGALGKQLDIGMVTSVDIIKAAVAGLNIAAIAGGHVEVEGSVTNALIARKDSGIKSIRDIAGKTVGTPTVGAILHVALLHWLAKEGIDPNSIRAVEVPFPNMADQMAAARIDVAVSAQPFSEKMLAAGNISLGNQLLQVASPVLATLWVADRNWIENNKVVATKWVKALRAAAEFVAKNPAESREILAKYTKLPPAVLQSIDLPRFDPALRAADLEVWIKVLAELKQLQRPIEASSLIVTAP